MEHDAHADLSAAGALRQKLAARIEAQGALSAAELMELAMADRRHGYYAAAAPFGAKGDFITAPEISQLFGEILAIWLALAWQALGSPPRFTLCEGGPGRGTLSDDILRALAQISPACAQAAQWALMEISPALRAEQRQKLAKHRREILWAEDCESLAAQTDAKIPLIFIANELMDALPAQQYQKTAQGWQERLIAPDAAGRLAFMLAPPAALPPVPPAQAALCAKAENGAILELSPARAALARNLAQFIHARGGAALLIDYGALSHGFGDTLQAVRKHTYAPPLENIGEADLSTHVDFAALAAAAEAEGCAAHGLSQGEFLLRLGLLERAGQLGAGKPAAIQAQIRADAERLAGAQHMGSLFKVLCLCGRQAKLPPFYQGES